MGNDPACMHPEDLYDHDERVCREPSGSWESDPPLVCEMQTSDPVAALDSLQLFGDFASGGILTGTGYRLNSLGNAGEIRDLYKRRLEQLQAEVRRMARANPRAHTNEEIARFASQRRNQIAKEIRGLQPAPDRVLLELRDRAVYGQEGRSYEVMMNRARMGRRTNAPDLTLSESRVTRRVWESATRSNSSWDQAAKGMKYFRHGGRGLLVLGVATTAHRLATASEDELSMVVAEEAGALAGGAIGTAIAVGFCVLIGASTGGLGFLAIGVVGGALGGFGGELLGRSLHGQSDGVLLATPVGTSTEPSLAERQLRKQGWVEPRAIEQSMTRIATIIE